MAFGSSYRARLNLQKPACLILLLVFFPKQLCTSQTSFTSTQRNGTGRKPFTERRLLTEQPCFVKTSGKNFTLCGKEVKFAGTNAYYLANIDALPGSAVSSFFQIQAQRGVTMVRMFAFVNGYGGDTIGPGADHTPYPLQMSIGSFNESSFRHLDRIIAAAGTYNIHLTLVLSNYLNSMGGIRWYVDQILNPDEPIEKFYSNEEVKEGFRNYVRTLLERTNTMNGVKYKDDPTIAAWDIMNEPQTTPFYEQKRGLRPGSMITSWTSELATFIRQNDPNHLICVGEVAVPYHQIAYWGSDYEVNVLAENIDFGNMHLYPESWGISNTVFSQPSLLAAQVAPFFDQALGATQAAGKPLMLQEYGATGHYANRDIVLNALHAAANARGLSSMVWQLTASSDAPGDGFNFGFSDVGAAAMKQQLNYVKKAF